MSAVDRDGKKENKRNLPFMTADRELDQRHKETEKSN